MINLKLADYGEKKERFERFGELLAAKHAEYGQFDNDKRGKIYFELGKDFISVTDIWQSGAVARRFIYKKDEKDPLNRFDGLFDGRTYGEGRFVLISDLNRSEIEEKMQMIYATSLAEKYAEDNEIDCEQSLIICFAQDAPSIENPELWEKVK